jgi:hypothetical protein
MTIPPTCPVCRRTFDGVCDHVMLQHLIINHPTEDVTQDLIRDEDVTAACRECSSWFDADVDVDVHEGILVRDAVCPDCKDEEPFRGLVVVPTTARAVVEGRETDANKPEGWNEPRERLDEDEMDVPESVEFYSYEYGEEGSG